MTTCMVLMQVLALTLWSVGPVQARANGVSLPGPTMLVGEGSRAAGAQAPCADMSDHGDCATGCCHHHPCDDVANCIAGAGASVAIMPCASLAHSIGPAAAAGCFPPFRRAMAGQSIPPPSRPPNG